MSPDPVTLDRRGDLAVITVDNPPVNATGHAVRSGLVRAVEAVAGDPAIRGVILRCAGRTFVAGADITEFGKPPASPSLNETYDAVEALAKPVVAVLHGTALGGGLELALSCHYRVIDPAGAVGLPEVTLGIIPGAGGTQRLPRLVGAVPALAMITSGRRVGAAEALRLGIADAVTSGDRLAFAEAFLRARLDEPVPRLSGRPFPRASAADLDKARAAAVRATPGQDAPLRAIDVVQQSAGLDFATGQELEQRVFEVLRTSPQSLALRHLFFAERTVGKVQGGGTPRSLDTVGVIGGGPMGAGVAAACLLAGLSVRMAERDDAALAAGRTRIDAILDEAVKRGKLAAPEREAITATRLRGRADFGVLADADLVVEAVFESLDVKRAVFRALDAVAKPGAVLVTGTSDLDVAAIADATSRPGDVIGLHVRSPGQVARLLEVVVPRGAAPDAVATGFALAKRLSALGVWAGNAEGFIGDRVLSACRRAADAIVENGASPSEVDAACRAYGFATGLYATQELEAGQAARLAPTRDPAERQAATHRAKEITPEVFTPGSIQHRILLAMVNEGAKVLDEGVALRASDIDVVMVNGYGFPRWRGGPMHAGEAYGLAAIRADLAVLDRGDPLWRVSPLLDRLARTGAGAGFAGG